MADSTVLVRRESGPFLWGSPEADLVVRSAGVAQADIDDLLAAPLDWPRVVVLAQRHRVLALLARALSGAGWRDVPAEVAESLAAYRARLTARNLFLSSELLRVVALLEGSDITTVPYKGPLLALSAYGDLGMRPFGDLDVLVQRADAFRAKAILLADGYRSLTPQRDERGIRPHPVDYAFELVGDRDRMVEIHWQVAGWMPLGLGDVLPDARRSALLKGAVNDLSPEHSLLVQCVHAHKHGWPRLEWIAAIAHTIDRNPQLDWDTIVRAAGVHRAMTSLAMGLVLAHDLAGAPVPAAVLEGPHVTRRIRATCGDVSAELFHGDGQPLDASATVRLHFRNRSARGRVRYLVDLVHPSERDLAFVRLPARLSLLYYAVRPIRMLVEHSRFGRRSSK